MSDTIGYTVSRVRNSIKAVKEDAFVTDRYLWSLVIKYAKLFMDQQDQTSLNTFKSSWKTICLELIEVDKVEACCGGIKSGCIIMRTKDPLPTPFDGKNGPLFRTVSSVDTSVEIKPTEPATYTSMTKLTTFHFNKNKYYWWLNGFMYFPNITYEAVKVEGVWEGDISAVVGDAVEVNGACTVKQDQTTSIPDELFAQIEQQVLAEILPQVSLPPDGGDDKQNIYR